MCRRRPLFHFTSRTVHRRQHAALAIRGNHGHRMPQIQRNQVDALDHEHHGDSLKLSRRSCTAVYVKIGCADDLGQPIESFSSINFGDQQRPVDSDDEMRSSLWRRKVDGKGIDTLQQQPREIRRRLIAIATTAISSSDLHESALTRQEELRRKGSGYITDERLKIRQELLRRE